MLFPARAGVILHNALSNVDRKAIPRTRGGDPGVAMLFVNLLLYSPHARG